MIEVRIGCRVEVSGGSAPYGSPTMFRGTVIDGPDKVGNWYVEWDGTDEDHADYGGRFGWEGLDANNVIEEVKVD